MPLRNLLSAERIAARVGLLNRAAVLDAAARLLAEPGAGSSPKALSGRATLAGTIGDALRKREQLASTAIGHGVAVPHARIDGIEESRAAFLRLDRPVDFNAADGEPVDLVLALVVPAHDVQQHLEFLAEVAEMFADPGYRAELRAATTVASLRRRLLPGDSHPAFA
jgi:PTS system nitrogen regulatory IIA component